MGVSAPGLDDILNAVARTAARLCEARDCEIFLVAGEQLRLVAKHGAIRYSMGETRPINRRSAVGRAVAERRTIHVRDITRALSQFPDAVWPQRIDRVRTLVAMPLLRNGTVIGGILIRRKVVRPFTTQQIALLRTFADQAAIAIENARLADELNVRNGELTEVLERETATSAILRVISRSPTDLGPVLDAVAESAARLCSSFDCDILRLVGDRLVLAAHHGPLPAGVVGEFSLPIVHGTIGGRTVLEGRTVHVADLQVEANESPDAQQNARTFGLRTMLSVPLMREGATLGVIQLRRIEVSPFTDKQIALLETFADQAVIAIENVRLFHELQARNRELTEALEQQTATGEILRVISNSPTDVQPVFDAIAESVVRLCEGLFSTVFRYDGTLLHFVAHHNYPIEAQALLRGSYPRAPETDDGLISRAIRDRRIVHVPDIETEPDVPEVTRQTGRAGGYRSRLIVPMLREGVPIGAIHVARPEPRPFSDKHIALVQVFANQAVIAIENVRLFNELGARNRDLTEALEQQTATSEVLKTISASPTDVQPVFDAIARNAARLCDAVNGLVIRFDGELLHLAADHNVDPDPERLAAVRQAYPRPPSRGALSGRAILTRAVVHVPDVSKDPEYTLPAATTIGYRSVLAVPMMHEGVARGTILVARDVVAPFSDSHITLLQTFADQAVIAIENVRLFTELQARNRELTEALEQQTTTSEILRVISSSPTELQPILDAVAENAARLCGANDAIIRLVEGDVLRLVAKHGQLAVDERMPLDRGSTSGRAVSDRRTIHIHDMAAETEAEFPIGKSIQQRFGYRTVLATPLLREGLPIGVIAIRRAAMQPFSDKQIALIQTFADQAVIAIENVRLFAELQARNRELSDTLEQQTATSEILQVISSSPTNPPSRPRSDRQKRGPGLQRPECHRLVDRGRCP